MGSLPSECSVGGVLRIPPRFLPPPSPPNGRNGPTMVGLLRPAPAVSRLACCQDAHETFLADLSLIALPVLDEAYAPWAIIDRHPFMEFFSRRYRRELFGHRSLGFFLEQHPEINPARMPMVVEADASLDDVAEQLMGAHPQPMTSALVVTRDNRYLGIASSHELLSEITRRKQEELYYLAHYDALTGIPNRMLFTDRLNQACREALRHDREVALLFVDVDRFKQVNDSMGHAFGDGLLCAIAQRLRECARESDTVARLGGDEFAILMDGVRGRVDAESLAQRLVQAMREPIRIQEREMRVSLSIGIALYPQDDRDAGALLSKADAAMYEVKTSGRNGFRSFEPGASSYCSEKSSLEAELKRALDHGEFALCYQPQIDLARGMPVGVEALIRWVHPSRGLLAPGSFIEIAEESGLIVPIGDWVLAEACRQLQEWNRQGLPSLRMGVNISALQFRQPDFVKRVKQVLSDSGVDPACVEFELTESMVMQKASAVLDMLNELKAAGVRLSLDDFGTGFSSLGYLTRFPIDRLKIDQSFVRGVDRMPVNASIIRAIAALARSLSLQVVAEGVETEAELGVVCECGCDESQGYLHARPMSPDRLADWLRDGGNGAADRLRQVA
ncbi:MAG: EAL domain-containing protein [Betaproteobacteria bacterium]|nr:EAL domain-containing protein [Betaproteobacteria bacterium]